MSFSGVCGEKCTRISVRYFQLKWTSARQTQPGIWVLFIWSTDINVLLATLLTVTTTGIYCKKWPGYVPADHRPHMNLASTSSIVTLSFGQVLLTSATDIHTKKHWIPSDHRSQAGDGPASTMHGILCAVDLAFTPAEYRLPKDRTPRTTYHCQDPGEPYTILR
ncbi:hypothetical protein DFS34DRAFT_184202 [Phlyctochytrium arcticum]|nr:hypothetical protein DFS34DRAFT_184202 [Phlyctochytrium arcticum]